MFGSLRRSIMMKQRILALLLFLIVLTGCGGKGDDGTVTVALLDTGVSSQALEQTRLLPGYNYVTGTGDTEDRLNHGTAVASIWLGCESAGVEALAPEAYVVPLVVFDKGTTGVAPDTLAQAIRDSVDRYDADILNISLGIRKDVEEVRKAIAYAERKGVLVVAAVGNEGDSEAPYYPAAYETVVAVGSHDEDLNPSSFSQKNAAVDLLAPGENLWLASRTGKPYGAKGTSFAAGHVTAAAVRLLLAEPGLKPAELRERLFAAAQDIGAPGYDPESGWGIACWTE